MKRYEVNGFDEDKWGKEIRFFAQERVAVVSLSRDEADILALLRREGFAMNTREIEVS